MLGNNMSEFYAQIGKLYNEEGILPRRYKNRNELLYAFRSVEKNMPFVRKIYLVTNGQVPNWYQNNEFPKVVCVSHEEIFPNQDHIPTFNSNAIEAHIHRIKGLSEIFLYMNDDCIVCQKTSLEDFFHHGKMKIYLDRDLSPTGLIDIQESSWLSAWKNTNRLLDEKFMSERRNTLAHAPLILNKSLCDMAWREFEKELTLTSSRKFRSIDTCLTTAGLFPYYSIL
jgi:hypothetical protein